MMYIQAKTPNGYAIVGLPWLNAMCPPKPLHHSPPQLNKEENVTKGLWAVMRRGTAITVMGKNRLILGEKLI